MANGKDRRRFGRIRRLPSGRYQARYLGPDGVDRPADDTFDTKGDAVDWLTLKEAEILEGDWIDPDAGNVLVPDYVETWIGKTLPCALRRSRSTVACSAAISRRTCQRLPSGK